jgi:hypothetical protein
MLLLPPLTQLSSRSRVGGRVAGTSPRQRPVGMAGTGSLSAALRTSAFWGLFAAYLLTARAAYSIVPHFVACVVEHGFDALFAATAFGLTGMLSAIGWLIRFYWPKAGGHHLLHFHAMRNRRSRRRLAMAHAAAGVCLLGSFVRVQGARGPIVVAMVAALFPGGVGAIYGALSLAQGFGAELGHPAVATLSQRTASGQIAPAARPQPRCDWWPRRRSSVASGSGCMPL